MSFIHIFLCLVVLWINLVGLGLLTAFFVREYAIARVAGAVFLCLAFYGFEHWIGLGPRLPLLLASSAVSVFLIVRNLELLKNNWLVEAAFAVGFLYCFLWRYSFPNIDLPGERIPDLVMIHNFVQGDLLPPVDRWLPPFKVDSYYTFQYYSAALMARWLRLDPGIAYNIGYCVLSGFMALSVSVAAAKLSGKKTSVPLFLAVFFISGTGVAVGSWIIAGKALPLEDSTRFLGLNRAESDLSSVGKFLVGVMYSPVKLEEALEIEFPAAAPSFFIAFTEFHPPLAGFVLLTFAIMVIAIQCRGSHGRERLLQHAFLAACIPLSIVGNTWTFPLLALLVGGWFVYCAYCGESRHWIAALIGGLGATLIAYPALMDLSSQVSRISLGFTRPEDRSSGLCWLIVFWPVVGMFGFSAFNREHRHLALFWILTWTIQLLFTEFIWADDIYGGSWERYNSILKWWGWVYIGVVLTLGPLNLSSPSRLVRYGSLVLILLPLGANGCILFNHYRQGDRFFAGRLDGQGWLAADEGNQRIIRSLSGKADGISLESGVTWENNTSTVLSLFARKKSFVGWVVQENIWRAHLPDIESRMDQVSDFYADKMEDPLAWLINNNIRYVLWLDRDNRDGNSFEVIHQKIKGKYRWLRCLGAEQDPPIGYWERADI